MAESEIQLVRKLNYAGERLSKPPASVEELLTLLDEVELLLTKVDQSASPLVQQALLPTMKALVSDQLFRNPDMDVKVTVATCINEIMRITAPDAPYNDERMKEFFELIVASFDSLSLVSGRSYTKAVSIIDNVSKVKSCVMMLDLECDALIIKMFEQFLKNIRSDHPHAVFSAMEAIMTLIIEESEDISLGLLKEASPMAWKLGSKVIESCAEKLKPYLAIAIDTKEISQDDYDPIVTSIWKRPSLASKQNHADESVEQVVDKNREVTAPSGKLGQFGNKGIVSPHSKTLNQEASTKRQNAKPSAPSKKIEKPQSADGKVKPKHSIGSKPIPAKTIKKPNPANPNEVSGKPSINKAKDHSLSNPQAQHLKSSDVPTVSSDKTSASEGLVPKEEPSDVADKLISPAAFEQSNHEIKKRRKRKEMSGGSGEKSLPSKLKGHSSENEGDRSTKKIHRRKQNVMTDEVFETPHGRKHYKDDLVGCRVKVWWPKDKTYYEGVVAEFDASKMKHRIEYDDGDEEILNLRKEIWEMIGDDEETDDRAAQPPFNLPQPKGDGQTPKNGTTVKDSASLMDTKSDGEEGADAKTEAKRRKLVDGEKS
ncbi:Sister chromatid cohesion protein PDS5 homolog C-like protein [Drosera capensis]